MLKYYVFAANQPARINRLKTQENPTMKVGPDEGIGAPVKIDGFQVGKILAMGENPIEFKTAVNNTLRWKKSLGECSGVTEDAFAAEFGYSSDFTEEVTVTLVPSVSAGRMMVCFYDKEAENKKQTPVSISEPDISSFSAEEQKRIRERFKRINEFGTDDVIKNNIIRNLTKRLISDREAGIPISEYTPRFVEPKGTFYLKALKLLTLGHHIALIGDAAVGKNTMADDLASMLNLDTFDQPCAEIDIDQISFSHEIKNGDTCNTKSPFLNAVESGKMIIMDEVNGARPGVTLFLNSLLDYRRKVTIPGNDGEELTVEVNPRTCFIFTMNVGANYAGTKKVNYSTIGSRVRPIHMTYQKGTVEKVFAKRGLGKESSRELAGYFESMREGLKKIDEEAMSFIDFRSFESIADCVREGYYASVRDGVIDLFINEVEDPDIRAALQATCADISRKN